MKEVKMGEVEKLIPRLEASGFSYAVILYHPKVHGKNGSRVHIRGDRKWLNKILKQVAKDALTIESD